MNALDIYTAPLRAFISADLRATRRELGLTQAQMAELLCIDWRSYLDLEHGKSLCCTRVFILYLIHCKRDYPQFFKKLAAVLKKAEDDLAG